VVYLPYTQKTSSTLLQKTLRELVAATPEQASNDGATRG